MEKYIKYISLAMFLGLINPGVAAEEKMVPLDQYKTTREEVYTHLSMLDQNLISFREKTFNEINGVLAESIEMSCYSEDAKAVPAACVVNELQIIYLRSLITGFTSEYINEVSKAFREAEQKFNQLLTEEEVVVEGE